jgi:dihydrodipicolinate synthase/N-acetylneuraminate lyase
MSTSLNSSDGATTVRQQRAALIKGLFPQGIPALWCPTLTHFAAPRVFDKPRIGAHLGAIAPFVKGILVPGSTGEGWEMQDAEIRELLAVALDAAVAVGIRVLIGVLKADAEESRICIEEIGRWLKNRTGAKDSEQSLRQSNVAGFTVCPPKGRDLSQPAIQVGLRRILELGLPVALYQLPQVTGNEMSPETVAELANEFPNFYLFKDTSGQDRVAASGLDFGGVFLVRGAEGDYYRWLKSGRGPYDGFLLSTANAFASQLSSIQSLLRVGRPEEARALSQRVQEVVKWCFDLVAGFPTGNPFTNANKVLDHIMAHGPAAAGYTPPLLYSGTRLPKVWVESAIESLRANGLLPARGYLEHLDSTGHMNK